METDGAQVIRKDRTGCPRYAEKQQKLGNKSGSRKVDKV